MLPIYQIPKLLSIWLVVMLSVGQLDGQTPVTPPFLEDFETDTLNSAWQPNPNKGIVAIRHDTNITSISRSGNRAMALGNHKDTAQLKKSLDLYLDLSSNSQVKLSFWIKSNGDNQNAIEGLWLSDDGGNNFVKAKNFNTSQWCNDYAFHPVIDIDYLATANQLNLTSDFVVRFVQKDNNDFYLPGRDGYFIDDVSVKAADTTVGLPFTDGFEGSGPLKQGWTISAAFNTQTPDSAAVFPAGIVQKTSNSTIAGVAQSGNQGLAMGKLCDGRDHVNALDLNLDLSKASGVNLDFAIKSNGDEYHPQDGIYFSDDGGNNFVKVVDLELPPPCNEYLKHPTLDVDALAAYHGLTLTDHFVIRFQQYDNQSIFNSDGMFFDNIAVTTDNQNYATLPYNENFENGLGQEWRSTRLDSQNVQDSIPSLVSGFAGIKDTSSINGIAYEGSKALGLGKSCGTSSNISSMDLHLDLSNVQQPVLSFWFRNYGDENHPKDEIWMSDDGGRTFTKVINFAPKDWCNTYGSFPGIPIDQVASDHGLSLTSEFIVRFHQTSNYPFDGAFDDGYFIDNVSVKEKSSNYKGLPFEDDFEDSLQLGAGWSVGYAGSTKLMDSNIVGPHGLVQVMDTNQIRGIAASGKQAVGLGKVCEGSLALNALDLHLNLASANQPELNFNIKSNDEESHPQDGIWFSNDGGSTFQKVWDFDASGWCEGYRNYPPLPIGKIATRHHMELTDQFIIRFQQYDNYFFTGSFKDGLFIDDVKVKEQETSWASIPYQEDFEGNQGFNGIWNEGNAAYTNDSGAFPVKPEGQVKKVDTNFLPNSAFSGQQALGLGKICDGSLTTNSVDFRMLKGNCDNISLQFNLKSNVDEVQSGDGIWLSNDQGQSFSKIYNYNFQLADQFYERFEFNLDTAAQSAGLILSDSLILRFQQQDDNDFFRDGRDGIFIDDVKLECAFPTTREVTSQLEFTAYPNPVKDELVVEIPNLQQGADLKLTIKNALGQVVKRLGMEGTQNLKRIDTKAMDSGVYFLTIQGAQSKKTVKFMKQ